MQFFTVQTLRVNFDILNSLKLWWRKYFSTMKKQGMIILCFFKYFADDNIIITMIFNLRWTLWLLLLLLSNSWSEQLHKYDGKFRVDYYQSRSAALARFSRANVLLGEFRTRFQPCFTRMRFDQSLRNVKGAENRRYWNGTIITREKVRRKV